VHCVGSKSALINNLILSHHLDIFALVETWHDGVDYKYVEKARSRQGNTSISMKRNHGGICVFMRNAFRVKTITLPDYQSVEILALSLQNTAFSTAIVTVYRPGSVAVTQSFFVEFADVLERCISYNSLIVVGDVNIHLDCSDCNATVDFLSILESFGLTDGVHQPTHNCHYHLDIFLTRIDQPSPILHVDPPTISDHSLIVASFVSKQRISPPVRSRVRRRKWRSFDIDNFCADFIASDVICDPPDDVSACFECYDRTLSSLLDKHAPEILVTQYARPRSPWFDTECHLMKVKTRKLEKSTDHNQVTFLS